MGGVGEEETGLCRRIVKAGPLIKSSKIHIKKLKSLVNVRKYFKLNMIK